MIADTLRPVLLALARQAVEARACGAHDELDRLVREVPDDLCEPAAGTRAERDAFNPAGLFVSLHTRDGELRGCIGCTGGGRPLVEALVGAASSATGDDPRFPPVSPSEVPGLDIEISVLTPFERIEDVRDETAIVVGRHGLLAEQGGRRGLLLPQVATEWGWTREVFLRQVCLKAGLAPDAWRHGATIYRFEAEVFGEAAQGAAPKA
jgi:AmmeMemoRadiSam system protein A